MEFSLGQLTLVIGIDPRLWMAALTATAQFAGLALAFSRLHKHGYLRMLTACSAAD